MADWYSIGAMLAVLTPLVGVPLTAVLFYLRGLREQVVGRTAQLAGRVERLDGLTDALVQRITEVERNCATREEWVRESMLARRERRVLTNAVVRLQTLARYDGEGLGGGLERAARGLAVAAERLERSSDLLGRLRGESAPLSEEQRDA